MLVKKILPPRWTFKTRKTLPTELPHYLVDVWSKEGDSYPHNEVFPVVWAQATEEEEPNTQVVEDKAMQEEAEEEGEEEEPKTRR